MLEPLGRFEPPRLWALALELCRDDFWGLNANKDVSQIEPMRIAVAPLHFGEARNFGANKICS